MIYLDHSATSLPKSEEVVKAFSSSIHSANSGRSGYGSAIESSRLVYGTRLQIAESLKLEDERGVIFTSGATESLNIALHGLCSREKKLNFLSSAMEHNAVTRPLYAMQNAGLLNWKVVSEQDDFYVNLKKELNKNIDGVVVNHVSNVTGRRLDLDRISKMVKMYNCKLIVDASQSLGCEPLNIKGIDILCASAHKGLRGPMGVGFLVLQENIILRPLLYGGTGSASKSYEMPEEMPDHLETGTLNIPGIVASGVACEKLTKQNLENHQQVLQEKRSFLYKELSQLNSDLKVIGPKVGGSALSLDFINRDSALIAHDLWKKAEICVRVGLHCSPLAHKTCGTFPRGTLRVSPAFDTAEKDLETFVIELRGILKK